VPLPAEPPLGASDPDRKWRLRVNTGTTGYPEWTTVRGMGEFQYNVEPTLQDDSDFDSSGFGSQTKTKEMWSVTCTVGRKTVVGATTYDPGQEFLRDKSFGTMGAANSVEVQFFEMEDAGPRVEAYQGFAAVSWSPNGGGSDGLSTVGVTLSGQGKLNEITHPDTV